MAITKIVNHSEKVNREYLKLTKRENMKPHEGKHETLNGKT